MKSLSHAFLIAVGLVASNSAVMAQANDRGVAPPSFDLAQIADFCGRSYWDLTFCVQDHIDFEMSLYEYEIEMINASYLGVLLETHEEARTPQEQALVESVNEALYADPCVYGDSALGDIAETIDQSPLQVSDEDLDRFATTIFNLAVCYDGKASALTGVSDMGDLVQEYQERRDIIFGHLNMRTL
jgi:hypothetical protein